MSVVLETGAEMEDLGGGWAAQEPPFSNAQEQQHATLWSHAAPLLHWKLQFKQTGE